MSGSATQMLVAANAEFLRSYPPFDRMEPEALAFLAERLRLAYYAGESTIVDPEGGPVETLRIVQRGKVQVRQAGEVGVIEASLLTLGPGECFPIGSVTGRRASTSEVMREALREWQGRRRHRAEAVAELGRLWDAGLASGEATDGEAAFARIRQALEAQRTSRDA